MLWLAAGAALAQEGSYRRQSFYERFVTGRATLYYGAAMPSGTQLDFVNSRSGAAFGLALEAVFPKHFSAGVRTGHQFVSERLPRQTYELGNGTISAVQTRTLSTVPVLATGTFHLTGVNAAVRPYVQAGVGGALVTYAKYWGRLAEREQGVRLAVAPAAGVRFQFGGPDGRLGADLQAQYQQVFFNHNEIRNTQNLLLSAGLSFRWY